MRVRQRERGFLFDAVLTVDLTCLPWFVDGFVSLDKDQTLFILNQHCARLPEFMSWSFYLDSEEHHLIGQSRWDLKYGGV